MENENKDGYVLAAFSTEPVVKGDNDPDQIELADKMDIKDSFISYINSDNYREIYEIYYPKLSKLNEDERRSIAIEIMKAIEEKYNYKPMKEYKLDDRNIYYIFDFIAFLEFNFVDFFADVWFNLNVDIFKVDISRFVLDNAEQIIKIIDENIPSANVSLITRDFLIDAPSSVLLKFFITKSINRKSEIKIKISENYLEGEDYEQQE